MGNITPDQLAALVRFASTKLGVSEEQLARTVQTGDTSNLGLSPEANLKLQSLLGASPETLLQSPQVRAMLQDLLGDK